jgi:hypothetical protein
MHMVRHLKSRSAAAAPADSAEPFWQPPIEPEPAADLKLTVHMHK